VDIVRDSVTDIEQGPRIILADRGDEADARESQQQRSRQRVLVKGDEHDRSVDIGSPYSFD
jgi:hypothetical protein